LTLWYSAVFIASSLALSIISYNFLSASLRDNRKNIQAKLEELTALARANGVEAIGKTAGLTGATSRRKAFFVLVHLVRLYAGPEWAFDVQLVLAAATVGAMMRATTSVPPPGGKPTTMRIGFAG